MKIVITGTSGFIGGRLLLAARAVYGADVTAFSSRPSEGSHIVYGNGNDFGLCAEELALVEDAEVLIHAGAFTPKSGAEANQVASCKGNITYTEKLLALPWHNLKKEIFLSTMDVYANVDEAISEVTPTVPISLYGLSKLYCERLVNLHAADRGIASQVLRIGHVYGPGEEKYAKVIPNAIRNIVAGRDVELWGEGKELRSFIYINDVVTAILNAVELREGPGIINVVGGYSISIRELLERLIAIGGRCTGLVRREFSEPTRDLVFDNTKLKRYLLPEESNFTTGLQAEFQHIKNLSEAPQ
jgi:UDP-glucose 4-epimerase